MLAAFIHDHNFVYDRETNLYYDGSGGAFDKNLWNRYLAIFDKLVVVGREIDTLPNKLVISSSENVSFELIKGAHGIINILKNKHRIKKEVQKIISEIDFAIIRLPSTLGKIAYEVCLNQRKNYVLEIVGDPFEAYWHHGKWAGKIIAPIEFLRLRKIVKDAGNVIYVTNNALQKRYPCANRTCSISNVKLESVVPREVISKFYTNPGHFFKVGLIGTFHTKYKGHLEALKAVQYLKSKGYASIELNFVGTGNPIWVEEFAKKYGVEEQVKILGAVGAGKDGIFPFLDTLDLYIHPSKTEGLPRVIIEAMSRGKMCLGSNVGGTAELLEEIYLHEPGDWKSLAIQIEKLLNCSPEEKISIAEANLVVSKGYLEPVLQKRRHDFIRRIIDHE